jgi:hypothetical protein
MIPNESNKRRHRSERPIVVHGLSFAKPHASESLFIKYRPPVEGAINIGLMHTSLDGSPTRPLYAATITLSFLGQTDPMLPFQNGIQGFVSRGYFGSQLALGCCRQAC